MAEILRGGVIGAGVFGGYHSRQYANQAGARLAAVYDPQQTARAEEIARSHGGQGYGDLAAFLKEVDVVTVASPGSYHAEGALAAERLRLDHALDLYRRGQVRLVIVAGPADAAAEGLRYLAERGLPPEALRPGAGERLPASLRASADAVRASGGSAAVLVGDPPQILRALKIARDLGLEAYSSPIASSPLTDGTARQAGFVLREAAAYLAYLFAQR